jgi:hypothetical protein
MRRNRHPTAEAMLERSFALEPALRAQLQRAGTDAAFIEDVLREVYARLLVAAEAGRVRARHLRAALFDILAEVLRTASPLSAAHPAASDTHSTDAVTDPFSSPLIERRRNRRFTHDAVAAVRSCAASSPRGHLSDATAPGVHPAQDLWAASRPDRPRGAPHGSAGGAPPHRRRPRLRPPLLRPRSHPLGGARGRSLNTSHT